MISVSLRMAASTVMPSFPMALPPRLRARGRVRNGERVGVSMGADMKALGGGAAHFSEVTVLPLSPSHSLVMPSAV